MEASWIQVPNNILSKVAQKYQRTEASLLEDVTTLRNWMKTQPHFPEILDDEILQNFLTLNKCSVEKAKQKIDMYYTLRSKMPEIFNNMNPKCAAMKQVEKVVCWVVLPIMTEEMYRVSVFKVLDKIAFDKIEILHLVSQSSALQEMRLKEDVIIGDVGIIDLEGVSWGFLAKITPPVLVKVLAMYEKVMSFPMKQALFINSPSFVGMLLTVLKSVLKPKLFDRIQVCEDTSILEKFLSKKCIPRDYGGDAQSVEELFEVFKIKMKEYQSRFDALEQMRVDESLRPEKLKNDEILGFHGNFKKLDFD